MSLFAESAARIARGLAAPVRSGRTAESYADFARRVSPTFQVVRHTRVLGSVMERVADGELRRVMIFMPPRHGKSECVSRIGAAYLLARDPRKRVALASYGAELAEGLSRDARRYWLASHGIRTSERDVRRARHDWETGLGGGMWATGFEGTATGKGFNYGIIDDCYKNAGEATSKARRAMIEDFWGGVWTGRPDAADAAYIIVTMRWLVDDLPGWLLEQERAGKTDHRWHVVVFDAIRSLEPYDLPPSCTLEPDWRREGEALWPERFDVDALEETRRAAGRWWSPIRQQRPRRGVPGALWDEELVESMRVADLPREVAVRDRRGGEKRVRFAVVDGATYLDPATTHGEDSDETGNVTAVLGNDGDIYVVRDDSGRDAPEVWARKAADAAAAEGAGVWAEANQGGEMIRATFRAARVRTPVKLFSEKEGKMLRAEPVKTLCQEGRVHLVGEFPQLEGELLSYTGIGDSPNRMDAFVGAVSRLAAPRRMFRIGVRS